MPTVVAVGSAQGRAKVKGVGKAIPPGPWANYVAWSLQIYGSTIEGVGYDPFAKNLYVLYPNGQFIIVPNMPIGVTNAIQSAPDRQAYVEALIATAVYPPLPDPFVTAVGTATGMATVSGIGASTLTSVGVAAGAATVSGVSGGSVGSATGVGTATGVGVPITTSVGSATGMATVSGLSPIIGVGTASGHATATGQSGSTGTASGSGAATGVGASTATSVGSATGTATASGAGTGLIIAVGSATGTGTATGQSGATCPMGNTFADGCPGAPRATGTTTPGPGQGLYQNTAFFTYCRQSSQGTYASIPGWNVAGVHYPVGIPNTVTLLDPTVSVPPGCTLNPTGSVLGGPQIDSNGQHNLTVSGYDFSLHGGIPLHIGAGTTGQLTLTNNKHVTGSNISVVSAEFTASFSGNTMTVSSVASGSLAIGQTVQGVSALICQSTAAPKITGGSGMTWTLSALATVAAGSHPCISGQTQGSMIAVDNGCTANVLFANNYCDGNALNLPMSLTAFAILDASGTITVQYNAILRVPARMIVTSSKAAFLAQFNYMEGFNYSPSDGHAETIGTFWGTSGTQPSSQYSFNTILVPSVSTQNNGSAPIYLTSGAPGGTITFAQADHNTTVTNLNDGVSTIQAGCVVTSYVTYGAVNFIDNYVDFTGSLEGAFVSVSSPVYETPPVFSGNVNMVNGAPITTGLGYP